MDKATLIGVGGGFGCIGLAIFLLSISNNSTYVEALSACLWNVEAFLLVLIGSVFATMITQGMDGTKNAVACLRKASSHQEVPLEAMIEEIVEFAAIARKEGQLALDQKITDDTYPFLAKGLRMVADNQDAEVIKTNLELEIYARKVRHANGKKFFTNMGAYAPAMGLMGTILAQVMLFKNMTTDVLAMGKAMGLALICTLWGTLWANLVCLPLADKLAFRAGEEALLNKLILEGVLGISREDSPLVLKAKLASFLTHGKSQALTS